MAKFEDLPNEIIYEMFDYLDFCQVFEIFFYLNTRFQYLLVKCPLFLKIDFSSISKSKFEDCCKYLIEPNRNRVISLHFSNPLILDSFISLFNFNSSFMELESIVFTQINFEKLRPILINLSSLHHLYSLTINNNIEVCDSTAIYRLIFDLPVLKSCIISPKFYGGSLSLNPCKENRSSIEYLSINRHCSLNQFLILLSYTPKLRHLSNLSISETSNTNLNNLSIIKSKLHQISLKFNRMSFETFKYLSTKLFVHIEILNICTRADDYYLIAERWEELIKNSLPNLRIFDFQHYWEPIDNSDNEQTTYHKLIDRFTTSFWINRKWFFAHQHFSRRGVRDAVFYSTNPYRRNLYELHERIHNDACPRIDKGINLARRVNIDDYRAATNSSLQFPYAKELCLWGKGAQGNFSFLSDLNQMFYLSKLTNFSVQCPDFGLKQFIEFLNYLPNVHSIILYSNTSYLSNQLNNQSIDFLTNKNRISNVIIRGICTFEQIQLLISICPYIKYLEIEIEEEQLELIIKFLLFNKTTTTTTNNIHFESSKTKFDNWQKKFFDLFSRTQQKKNVTSEMDLINIKLNQYIYHQINNLVLLTFFNPKPTMELKLQRILTKEKLIENYSIGSAFNYLYLWW